MQVSNVESRRDRLLELPAPKGYFDFIQRKDVLVLSDNLQFRKTI